MSSGLSVSLLSVQLGSHTILDEVDLVAAPGAVTGLIGPNGAGKSTLMRAILGLAPLNSGRVFFEGNDILAMPRRTRAQFTAFVEQSSTSEARLTAYEVASLGRIPFQTIWQTAPSASDTALIDAALAAVDMTTYGQRLYHTLSGGEQQRVQIARALAQQPRLLLLDEPTSHLDVLAQLAALELLRRCSRDGATVLVALHDLNLAATFCDSLVVLQGGRQVAAGAPDKVLTPAMLRSVYRVDATILRHPGNNRPLIAYDLPV